MDPSDLPPRDSNSAVPPPARPTPVLIGAWVGADGFHYLHSICSADPDLRRFTVEVDVEVVADGAIIEAYGQSPADRPQSSPPVDRA